MLSRGLSRFRKKSLIQGALPIPAWVNFDVFEPSVPYSVRNVPRDLCIQRARKFRQINLDARQITVSADAELPETEIADGLLCSLDLTQQFRSHGSAIRNSR
jgi:hypothetical protein